MMNSRIVPVLKESIGILGVVAMTLGLLGQAFGNSSRAFISLSGNNGEDTAAVMSWENLDPSDDALDSRHGMGLTHKRAILAYHRSLTN